MTDHLNSRDRESESDSDGEIQQLRDQVVSLELSLADRTRDSLLLSTLLLILCPYVFYLAAIILDQTPHSYGFAYFVIHGSLAGCLLAQWSLISVFCMLNWRTAWSRCLFFVGLATLIAATSIVPIVMIFVWINEIPKQFEVVIDFAYLFFDEVIWLPGMIALSILPSFGLKVFRRWTIGPSSKNVEPRAATLATYFITIAFCAAGLAVAQWLWALLGGAYGGGPDPIAISILFFSIYASVSALVVGFVHVWILENALNGKSFRSWIWRIPVVLFAGGLLIVVLWFIGLQVDSVRFSRLDVWQVAGYNVSAVSVSSLVFWCGCRWVRTLGVELYFSRNE